MTTLQEPQPPRTTNGHPAQHRHDAACVRCTPGATLDTTQIHRYLTDRLGDEAPHVVTRSAIG